MSDADSKPVVGAWEVLASDELYRNPYFAFRRETCMLPNERIMPAYYVWEMVDWVNVVALTRAGQLILVNQYRHAAKNRFVEFPGGTTEPAANESHEQAARRELREETGYVPGALHYLGMHYPNPGLQDNRMHVYLAVDCERMGEPTLDPFEDIEVELVEVADFLDMFQHGRPIHALMMASLTMALPAIKKFCANVPSPI
ncbi:MAG: NUDIX hydrolase [Proteobacteria bacterium]|nr:NUDIX hydrolase [Pseudomonadota bacterium]MBK8957219.1 NUDIX hydrolase [Pseudomonadota bacterium]